MPHAYLKCTCHDLADLKALDFASSVDAPQSSIVTYPLTVILNTAFSYVYIYILYGSIWSKIWINPPTQITGFWVVLNIGEKGTHFIHQRASAEVTGFKTIQLGRRMTCECLGEVRSRENSRG